MKSISKFPMILIILDGWGYRKSKLNNAISLAQTPTWDFIWKNYPHTTISASGKSVGLPNKKMGNSEVGHINIGSGRIIYQNLEKINYSIFSKTFFQNKEFNQAINKLLSTNNALHIMGLISDGGVHSHILHIISIIELALLKNVKKIYIHAFLDGRDTSPKSAKKYISILSNHISRHSQVKIASLSGRFYAMDRNNNWERTKKAYLAIAHSESKYFANTPEEAIKLAYSRGETDEFIYPTIIKNKQQMKLQILNGDAIFFMNFRSDRAIQLSESFILNKFDKFKRKKILLSSFVTLTKYKKNLPAYVAFQSKKIKNTLGEYLSTLGFRQLRIAETEKYAHITFFLNGGKESPFPGEYRKLILSPDVKTYDLKPEMSAIKVTDAVLKAMKSHKYDIIIINYANADMVGHTGNIQSTIQAIECIDSSLKKIITLLAKIGGQLLITSDHGNAEKMVDHITGLPHTAHTNFSVPLIYVGYPAIVRFKGGKLSDIAPTLLNLIDVNIPNDMTGKPIFKKI